MIIMINGAFGVGKTSVAQTLQRSLDNSMLYDPEEVGFMLRNIITKEMMTPEETTDDFQDLGLWKKLTVEVANHLLIQYKMNLIVPMTIHNRSNFQYILNGFKKLDDQTYHFCLTAKKETIHDRLFKRGEQEGNWCFEQTSKCIEAFTDKAFEEFITTDSVSVNQIVTEIMRKLS